MKIFLLLAIAAILLGGPLAASDVSAHVPTAVTLSAETETKITITWVHLGSQAANGCGSGCGLGDSKRFVDVLRGSTNIVNNSTLQTYTDHSLSEGTEYNYTVCHGDPSTTNCAVTATYALKADPAFSHTLAGNGTGLGFKSLPDGSQNLTVTLATNPTSIDVLWAGPTHNNTNVIGLKVQYQKAGDSSFTTSTENSTGINGGKAVPVHTITGLTSGATYTVKLSGVTGGDSSGSGAVGTASTLSAVTLPGQTGTIKNPTPQVKTIASGQVVDGNLKATLFEDKGWDRILNVALYTNISADQGIENSDTYITWNFFDGVSVTDPHGYFNDVNVVAEQSGVRTQDFTYEITWNKPLGANSAIIETKDFQSNAGLTVINEAWTSFPVTQVSYEVPEETSEETVMALYDDGGVMNHLFLNNNIDYALLSDLQYFVTDGTIDVSQDEKTVVQNEDELVKQLFEKFTVSHDNVKIGQKYVKTLVISGTVNDEFFAKEPVMFSISHPDGTESKINAYTTSAGTFKVPIIVDEFESGVYQFTPSHGDLLGELFSYKH